MPVLIFKKTTEQSKEKEFSDIIDKKLDAFFQKNQKKGLSVKLKIPVAFKILFEIGKAVSKDSSLEVNNFVEHYIEKKLDVLLDNKLKELNDESFKKNHEFWIRFDV